MDAVIVDLYLFLHPVVAVLVGEVDNLRQVHVTGCFPLHLLVVHHDFTVENFLFYPFIEVVRHRSHKHALREVGYFAGGIRLSIWVLIEVDFSRWLIVMLCRFCNTFPKRSDRIFAVSPTT